MRRTIGVLSALLFLLATADVLSAQDCGSRGFALELNYPNPSDRETTIRFILCEEIFVDGRTAVVSMRIFNLLAQPVVFARALGHSAGAGVELRSLTYSQPGRHEALWDGTDQSGRPVASGLYLAQLTVNGQSVSLRMVHR